MRHYFPSPRLPSSPTCSSLGHRRSAATPTGNRWLAGWLAVQPASVIVSQANRHCPCSTLQQNRRRSRATNKHHYGCLPMNEQLPQSPNNSSSIMMPLPPPSPSVNVGFVQGSQFRYVTLKCMGDHKVVEFRSKGQTINFQTVVGGTPLTRCFS
jgi:hypothetical protein